MPWDWLKRFAILVVAGMVFAVIVTELELAFGVDLLDAPFFHAPILAIVLVAVALALVFYQARPGVTPSARIAAVLAFGLIVMPYNAFSERPAVPVDFWAGNAGLFLDRTMTVNRPHAVALVIKGSQPITKGAAVPDARDVLGADTIVARLSADPRQSFSLAPEAAQAKPIALGEDLRWTWTATPRQEGPQRLVLELDSLVKNRGAPDKASSLYRQYMRVSVQPPSWYEAARKWLFDQLFGS
jgi:hypothetical protein